MNEIPIIVEFEENEFDSYLNDEEIKLSFIVDYNTGYLVHNFKNWNFLSKFKNLKILELSNAEIKQSSDSFFKNLYSLEKLEKLIIDNDSIILLPKKALPTDLFPKNFKEYQIKFHPKYWPSDIFQPKKGKDYENYEGIGNFEDLENRYEWFTEWLPQLYDFPNILKFKKLQTLNFYNIFDNDSYQGHLFEMDNSKFYKKLDIIKSILKSSKTNKINIFGLNLNNKSIYRKDIATDEKDKTFTLFDSEIFKSITELYNIKKVIFNNEDPLKYLKKYYKCSNLKEITKIAKTNGIPKGVKNFII